MAPPYTASIIVDEVIDALAAFLQPFAPGTEIVRGQVNRVAQPLAPVIVLTELLQIDIETPTMLQLAAPEDEAAIIIGPKRIDIQIDFYGDPAGDQCAAVKTVYRTPYSFSQFPDGIKPLYCDEGRQMPMITGEQQYQSRWTLTASLQYNPTVTLPQQSAIALEIDILEDIL